MSAGLTSRSAAYHRKHEGESIAQWSARMDERAARLERSTHYVYRAFDAYDLLLYIGCTVNLGGRLSNHRGQSAWYAFLDDMQIVAFPTRSGALEVEALAIETEGAYFNATRHDIFQTQARRVAGQQYPERSAAELDLKYPALSYEARTARYLAARHIAAREAIA